MSVLQKNRDVLLKEIRVAKVLPVLRKHLPETLIGEIENQLTIRRFVYNNHTRGCLFIFAHFVWEGK